MYIMLWKIIILLMIISGIRIRLNTLKGHQFGIHGQKPHLESCSNKISKFVI